MLDNKDVIEKLNHLLGTIKDGETGYREAANDIDNADLKTMFNRYAQQRAELAAGLKQQIRELGGEPDDSGSIAAAMHRTWLSIREAVASRDMYAIVAEVERGEDVAIDNYQSVLQEDLPANIKDFVSEQYKQVKTAHDKMRDLKHKMES